MEDISTICRQFKLNENCHVNIGYSLIECYKHSFEKAIVYLNYDNNKHISIIFERETFEDIVEDFSLKNFFWYLVPKYVEYKTNARWKEENC